MYEQVRVLLKGMTKKVPEEYMMYLVQKEMGWDYHTYMAQPADWIEKVSMFILLENSQISGK